MSSHSRAHGPAVGGQDHRRRLAVVLGITTTILVVEVVGALVSGSRRYWPMPRTC